MELNIRHTSDSLLVYYHIIASFLSKMFCSWSADDIEVINTDMTTSVLCHLGPNFEGYMMINGRYRDNDDTA